MARRVVVVAYVREHISWMASLYNQQCKVGNCEMPIFESWALEQRQNFLQHRLLRNWAECFGLDNMLVRVYRRDRLVDRDIVTDFFDAIACNLSASDFVLPNANANDAVSVRTAEVIRIINKQIADPLERRAVAQFLAQSKILPDRPGDGVMRRETRSMLEAYFERDRHALHRDFLGGDQGCFDELGMIYDKNWYGGITQAELNHALSLVRAEAKTSPVN